MKRMTASGIGVFTGAHKWFTGIVTTSAALLALMVNAKSLGITPWFSFLDLNFADHAASRIVLAPRGDTLRSLGDTTVLTATVTDARGAALAGATLRWRSLDSSIASVDSGGAVVARAPGRVEIEVGVREVVARAVVVVRPEPVAIVLTPDSTLRLADGDSLQLTAHAVDARGRRVQGRELRWESADSAVVRVDTLGFARALAAGRAYVWASTGPVRARLRVDVELVPAALVLQSGEGQRALAGRRLPEPVVLQVRARGGQPVAGATVTLATDDAEGAVDPGTAVSDAEGRVRAAWTLSPRAGTQRLLARVATLDSALAVGAEADPVPGNVRIEVVTPELKGAVGRELGQPVVVRVTDSIGVALGQVRLAWQALDGGSVTGSVRTDSTGTAQAYWTLGRRAGNQRLLVQVGNPRLIPATRVAASADAGAASAVVVQAGQGQRALAGHRLPKAVVLLVRDSSGNPVGGAALRVVPAAGEVEDTLVSTGADGRATIRWTLGAVAGEQRLAATLDGGGAATQVVATARVGPAAALTLGPPTAAGSTLRLVATVTDSHGNPVRGAAVSVRATTGTVSPARGVSDSAGRIALRWTPAARSTGEVRLAAAVTGTRLAATRVIRPASR